jgi:uncharacterized protein (DUF488 family)
VTDAAVDVRLFTIGHSNHTLERFVELLRLHAVTAIADVRSSPYSKFNPHFNRETLEASLRTAGIRYVFLGDELGARRSETEAYDGGTARYERIAQLPAFQKGLDRVRRGLDANRIALMCAEKDPLTCHRAILVCRHLHADALPIHHILDDAKIESHSEAEERLLALVDLDHGDLFCDRGERLEQAYEIQGSRIAYTMSAESPELVP